MTVGRYPKGSEKPAGEHFKAYEFDCPCEHCYYTLIDEILVSFLDALRRIVDTPIKITSGYRCDRYQYNLSLRGYETAKGISTHQVGKAADIQVKGYSGVALESPARSAGFRAVGVGSNFVHVDTRGDKDRAWTYRR